MRRIQAAVFVFAAVVASPETIWSQSDGGRPAGLEDARPIEAVDTVFTEEMTWMEVGDAIRAGKTTAIVATGGLEQNGPHVATGKHNFVLRSTTEAIAMKGLAGVGAVVGGLIGGKKGAAVGGAAGGGAGTTVVLTTKGEEAVLEEGASFSVRLRAPFTVTRESPR